MHERCRRRSLFEVSLQTDVIANMSILYQRYAFKHSSIITSTISGIIENVPSHYRPLQHYSSDRFDRESYKSNRQRVSLTIIVSNRGIVWESSVETRTIPRYNFSQYAPRGPPQEARRTADSKNHQRMEFCISPLQRLLPFVPILARPRSATLVVSL